MTDNQAYLFIVFTIVGVVIGILFDIFRILRKVIKTKDMITYIEDIIFWIITGLIIIFIMYKFCDGELRMFMIIGIAIGVLTYILTVSKLFISISLKAINIIKKVIIYPGKIVLNVIRRVFLKPIVFICINIRKKFVKKN